MYRRKTSREQGRAAQKLAVAKSRVKKQMDKMGYGRLAAQGDLVEWVAEWLDNGALYISGDNVRAALAERGVPVVAPRRGSGKGMSAD